MSAHYEWSVMDPDGQLQDGIYTIGPHGPRQVIEDGGHLEVTTDRYGEIIYDTANEPIMRVRRQIPNGCIVVRRVVTRGDWEPADDALYPGSATSGSETK